MQFLLQGSVGCVNSSTFSQVSRWLRVRVLGTHSHTIARTLRYCIIEISMANTQLSNNAERLCDC